MKSTLAITLLAALLGGCATGPYGYDGRTYYRGDGYARGPGYDRGSDRGYYRGDVYSQGYNSRQNGSSPANPFKDHGS